MQRYGKNATIKFRFKDNNEQYFPIPLSYEGFDEADQGFRIYSTSAKQVIQFITRVKLES
jgi:hypothetical protein